MQRPTTGSALERGTGDRVDPDPDPDPAQHAQAVGLAGRLDDPGQHQAVALARQRVLPRGGADPQRTAGQLVDRAALPLPARSGPRHAATRPRCRLTSRVMPHERDRVGEQNCWSRRWARQGSNLRPLGFKARRRRPTTPLTTTTVTRLPQYDSRSTVVDWISCHVSCHAAPPHDRSTIVTAGDRFMRWSARPARHYAPTFLDRGGAAQYRCSRRSPHEACSLPAVPRSALRQVDGMPGIS